MRCYSSHNMRNRGENVPNAPPEKRMISDSIDSLRTKIMLIPENKIAKLTTDLVVKLWIATDIRLTIYAGNMTTAKAYWRLPEYS